MKVEVSDGRDTVEQEWTVHVEGELVTKKTVQKVVKENPKKVVVKKEPKKTTPQPGDFLFYVVEDWKE